MIERRGRVGMLRMGVLLELRKTKVVALINIESKHG